MLTKEAEIVQFMGIPEEWAPVQRIQTAHRLRLIEFWEIPPGAKVLEIGCGQGDTLAALSYIVGDKGFVHGVDIAEGDYGEPETLGEARERLLKSPLGANMKIDFQVDVLSEEVQFHKDAFDYVVLSHCLWYLSSQEELTRMLTKIRPWSKQLCIAEWNPNITLPEQLPHLQAVTIQAICESYKSISHSNVRTLFYPKELTKAVMDAGWTIEKIGSIHTKDMQDGLWEVGTTRAEYPEEIRRLEAMPQKLKDLLMAQIEELQDVNNIKAMGAFVIRGKSNE